MFRCFSDSIMAAEERALAIPKPRKKAPTSNAASLRAQAVIMASLH